MSFESLLRAKHCVSLIRIKVTLGDMTLVLKSEDCKIGEAQISQGTVSDWETLRVLMEYLPQRI